MDTYFTGLQNLHPAISDHVHHDHPAHDPLDNQLRERLQLDLQWLESQSSGETKPIDAAAHVQKDLFQRRQPAQETQKSHPDPVIVLVAALGEVHVAHAGQVHVAHAGHHLAANFPETNDLDVVENASRDDGEEVLGGGEADVEENSRKGHELALIADLAARGVRERWKASCCGTSRQLEASRVSKLMV
jgi:hypothetical protein